LAKKMQRNWIIVMAILLGLHLFSGVLPLAAEDERLINGLRLGPYQAGGKSFSEVQEILAGENEAVKGRKVSLHIASSGVWLEDIPYGELGIQLDLERIWREAYQVGRTGSWWQRWYTRWQVRRKGQEIPLYLKLDRDQGYQTLQNHTKHLRVPAQDARLMITPKDKVVILPSVAGREPNLDRLLADLEQALTDPVLPGIRLDVAFRTLEPKITTAEVESYRITGLVSSFSTSYNPQKVNRSRNIELAAKAIDGYLLPPGEIFSFNQVVGPRTKERGYDEADVILNKRFVPDVGGGVCQVSTTLYNAVLRANLEIIERHPHSILIRYVEPGMDAAVAYGSLDFVFRNNTEGHILIKSKAQYGTVTFKIFGLAQNKKRVTVKSFKEKEVLPETIYQNDPSVPQGQYILEHDGSWGMYVRVERYVYEESGRLLSKEIVSRDYYPPVDRVIRTGTDPSLLSIRQ